jgi:hypothetical protein
MMFEQKVSMVTVVARFAVLYCLSFSSVHSFNRFSHTWMLKNHLHFGAGRFFHCSARLAMKAHCRSSNRKPNETFRLNVSMGL